MTDNEIIEALDKCASIGESCEGCPFYEYIDCDTRLKECFHDLIKRKDAEIDRLQRHNKEYGFCNLLGNCLVYSKNLKDYNDMRKGLKAEAIKEFAERLKEELMLITANGGGFVPSMIDNLVKEMTVKGGAEL